MENIQFSRPQQTSSARCGPSPDHQLYAAERAKILFGGYRRGDANDPDIYVASIAAVLAEYDAEIIREVTDPRTGISTCDKYRAWPPNSGELKSYCDAHYAHRARLRKYMEMPHPNLERLPPPAPREKAAGIRGNLLVRRDRPGFDAMVERSKTADAAEWRWDPEGIRVPVTWWTGSSFAPAAARRI
jgi:hypothetical protein